MTILASYVQSEQIELIPTGAIWPSPENDAIYKPVDQSDSDFIAMVENIREVGILCPLVITQDSYIVSGHRRHAAAVAAGLGEVPCRRIDIDRATTDRNIYIALLRDHNRQRFKSYDECVREEIISIDKGEAYGHLTEYRNQKRTMVHSGAAGDVVELREGRDRSKLSDAKAPLIDAILKILDSMREYWPVSVRQIHYRLLNEKPLIHASKPKSKYKNDKKSYRAATDAVARGRIEGKIPYECITDETRPLREFACWRTASAFVSEKNRELFMGYWRDLMQSQPSYIEILAEKLTVGKIAERAASDYTIPVNIGRGYCSVGPRYELAQRFAISGRETLTVIIASDFDPEGVDIAESYALSMHKDFGIARERIRAIRVALTMDQITRLKLPPGDPPKKTSSRYKRFLQRYGNETWELEALSPETLQAEIANAINAVIDHDAFEYERQREAEDARNIEATRKAILRTMGEK